MNEYEEVTEYNFWAICNVPGGAISERCRLNALTFGEACYIIQENEIQEALEDGREPVMYNEFKEII